MNVYLKIWNIW